MAAKLKIEKRGDKAEAPDKFLEVKHPMTISSTFSSS
jgi:hypothetical protein